MNRRPTDEQTQQTGDDFTQTDQTTDSTQGPGKVRAEHEDDTMTDQRIGDPNIINR
jgi:hypothetical protein